MLNVPRSLPRIVLVVIAAMALAIPAAAGAHRTGIYHGRDHATNDHSHWNTADHECDGNFVYGYAYDVSGRRGPSTDRDGCGGHHRHVDGLRFRHYNLCEQGVSCTRGRDT